MDNPQQVVIYVVALLISVTIHEAAHGWMALRNGDPTAKLAGRVTLNPLPHIDLFGSIIFPALLIWMKSPILLAWAKPVPVNHRNFRNPRKGFAQVSVAGPASNFLLAGLAALMLHGWLLTDPSFESISGAGEVRVGLPLFMLLVSLVRVNVFLGLFNLFPIPPLDGGHFLMGVLPPEGERVLARLEPYGFVIIMGLAYAGVLWKIIDPVAQMIFALLGLS